jgi:Thiol:disulfide interchange protein DsbD, N-terminal
MRLRSSCKAPAGLLVAAAAILLVSDAAIGQFRGVQAASVIPPTTVGIKAGQDLSVPLKVAIRPGYHINSNTPAEDYLIPTRLTWSPGLKVKSVKYPEAETVKYEFSEKPLSVFSGTITLHSVLAVPDPIPSGLKDLTAKLRYQACNEKACLPPVTIDVTVPVTID